jgi:hypothetical protein
MGCSKKKDTVSTDKLVFGTFHGMCLANCVRIYQVDGNTLQKDDSADHVDVSWTYNFKGTSTLSADNFNMAKGLLDQIPAELLINNNKTYGSPDSHDQGGVFVVVEKGSEKHRFRIDFDDSPDQSAELVQFKNKIAEVVGKLH